MKKTVLILSKGNQIEQFLKMQIFAALKKAKIVDEMAQIEFRTLISSTNTLGKECKDFKITNILFFGLKGHAIIDYINPIANIVPKARYLTVCTEGAKPTSEQYDILNFETLDELGRADLTPKSKAA